MEEKKVLLAIPQTTTVSSGGMVTTTIEYDYDPLNRLTGATYSSGEVYTYSYDKAGNRTSMVAPSGATTYLYNEANQLTHANGITHTWDANGNLLNDGVYTYEYDYANRLAAVSDQDSAFSFAYNGLGDRYQQVVNGETITYTLDLAAALPQVLADGTNTYLYGMGRIAQQNTNGMAYYLPDALGSARQLSNGTGVVTSAQSYDPFGNPLRLANGGSSGFGYTGEWTDPTGLQYLRARYYSPQQGRFLTIDPFPGLIGLPSTQHSYNYAINNPIRYTDPSGEFVAAVLIGSVVVGGIVGLGYYGVQHLLSDSPCAQWDWIEAALWTGAGALVGLGAGALALGGWWVGAQIGLWGTTAATIAGADGDPTNEAAAIFRAIQNGLYAVRNGIGQGYESFKAFKRAHGNASPGMAWHHIVTQTSENIRMFGERAIHNTNNLIQLPHGRGALHQQVTGYYNSIRPEITGSTTLRVYEWLQTQSFESQWMFGIKLIRSFGGASYIIDKFLR